VREPKNLARYSPKDVAAKGLEDLARDIRQNSGDGTLVRWDINMSFWHPSWKTEPRAKRKGANPEVRVVAAKAQGR
jgi:hypothetical protein